MKNFFCPNYERLVFRAKKLHPLNRSKVSLQQHRILRTLDPCVPSRRVIRRCCRENAFPHSWKQSASVDRPFSRAREKEGATKSDVVKREEGRGAVTTSSLTRDRDPS